MLPKGITIGAVAKRIRDDGLVLAPLLGDTPVLVFRPKEEGAASPVYDSRTRHRAVPNGATRPFRWEDESAPEPGLVNAVLIPLTVSNRNLLDDQILVGRDSSCDIRLVSPQVSKIHVRFVRDEHVWRLVDQGSSNGTLLNNLRVQPDKPYDLAPSDEIVIGDVVVHYLDPEGLLELTALVGRSE